MAQKNCGSKIFGKIILVERKLCVKKNVGQKNFVSENIFARKSLMSKNILVRKNFLLENILGQKMFGKNIGFKRYGSKKSLVR